jgi:hypothetical protein
VDDVRLEFGQVLGANARRPDCRTSTGWDRGAHPVEVNLGGGHSLIGFNGAAVEVTRSVCPPAHAEDRDFVSGRCSPAANLYV